MKKIEEIKSLLRGLEEQTRKEYNAEIIGVFGSHARGEQKKAVISIFSSGFMKGLHYLTL